MTSLLCGKFVVSLLSQGRKALKYDLRSANDKLLPTPTEFHISMGGDKKPDIFLDYASQCKQNLCSCVKYQPF